MREEDDKTAHIRCCLFLAAGSVRRRRNLHRGGVHLLSTNNDLRSDSLEASPSRRRVEKDPLLMRTGVGV
jgi:hypothetical protein